MLVELPNGAKRKLEVVVLDHEVTSVMVATVQLGQQKPEGLQVSQEKEDELDEPPDRDSDMVQVELDIPLDRDSDMVEVELACGSMVRT